MKDINFLFTETIAENNEEAENKKGNASTGYVIITVLISLVAVGVLLAPGYYLKKLDKQITSVEQQLTDQKYIELRNVKAKLDAINTAVNGKKAIINDIDSKSMAGSQILLIAEQAVPPNCYFKSLKYSGGSLNLSGKAGSSFVFAELMSNLDRLSSLSRLTESLSLEETQSNFEFNIGYSVSQEGGK